MRVALFGMDLYKAPRLDGVQAIFFKHHSVGDKLWAMVRKVFAMGHVDLGLVETLIVLIPKMDPPSRLKDLHPFNHPNAIHGSGSLCHNRQN